MNIPFPSKTTTKLKKKNYYIPSATLLGGLFILLIALTAFLWRLASLTNDKLSVSELVTKHNMFLDSPWWQSPAYLNGPYYGLLHATYAISRNVFFFRLASVFIGIMTSLVVYWLVSQWHGYKIAILSSLIFISNFGVLTLSRQANPDQTQLLLIIALLTVIILINRYPNYWTILGLIIIISGSLYIPAAVWLVLATLWFSYPVIKQTLAQLDRKSWLSLGFINLVLIAPLAYRLIFFYSNKQLLLWLGYNLHGTIAALSEYAINLGNNFLDLFIHTANLAPTLSLGRLPLMPVADSVLIGLAIYFYATHFNNYRWRALLILLVGGWLVTGLGVLSVFSLLPLLTLSIGTSLTYLLKEWHRVFPFNPIARQTGMLIMSLAILLTCFYTARSYFVAWAYDPSTSHQYVARRL